MLIDIILFVVTISVPVFVFLAGRFYKTIFALLVAGGGSAFWLAWLFLDTAVPFALVDKVVWFIISLAALLVALAAGLFLGGEACDPKIEECEI
jgi:hypothetical protein